MRLRVRCRSEIAGGLLRTEHAAVAIRRGLVKNGERRLRELARRVRNLAGRVVTSGQSCATRLLRKLTASAMQVHAGVKRKGIDVRLHCCLHVDIPELKDRLELDSRSRVADFIDLAPLMNGSEIDGSFDVLMYGGERLCAGRSLAARNL